MKIGVRLLRKKLYFCSEKSENGPKCLRLIFSGCKRGFLTGTAGILARKQFIIIIIISKNKLKLVVFISFGTR